MWTKAENHLKSNDPVLAKVMVKVGPCTLVPFQNPFTALVQAVVSQQLSTKAATTIIQRLNDLFPRSKELKPHHLLKSSDQKLRQVGLSRQKITYLKGIAEKSEGGEFRLKRFRDKTDEEIVKDLIQIKGIGRWTAEMFLIFVLARPDVLPLGDLAFRNAVHGVYRLRKAPTDTRILTISKPWEPYRSIGTWYMWALVDNTPGIW